MIFLWLDGGVVEKLCYICFVSLSFFIVMIIVGGGSVVFWIVLYLYFFGRFVYGLF